MLSAANLHNLDLMEKKEYLFSRHKEKRKIVKRNRNEKSLFKLELEINLKQFKYNMKEIS